jgi:YD repeat-containing protein
MTYNDKNEETTSIVTKVNGDGSSVTEFKDNLGNIVTTTKGVPTAENPNGQVLSEVVINADGSGTRTTYDETGKLVSDQILNNKGEWVDKPSPAGSLHAAQTSQQVKREINSPPSSYIAGLRGVNYHHDAEADMQKGPPIINKMPFNVLHSKGNSIG